MILLLNEQEIIDGVCVFVANKYDVEPQDVNLQELSYNKSVGFTANATFRGHYNADTLDTEDISEGIVLFLEEFHSFNPDVMTVELKFHKNIFSAEVRVNEDKKTIIL
ncbi:DUF2653 family protein [Bacillus sp. RG28]|uniref:DUF2653 family protein n=1 Tax=Gottfriedia endophytica TaxID=2820819 RepID=A0A940NLX4_9BACI|nr:DUF2653 family protein [Gottfriedia endophytica]MBP0726672.1 DUF2653 family protein [Gottfriedia endophytica]